MSEPDSDKRGKTTRTERLRVALGVTGRRVPRVGLDSLRRFHAHLKGSLTFPFAATLAGPVGPHRDTATPLSVVRLLDPAREYEPEEMYGLICKAEQADERIELPLGMIDVAEDGTNRRLLADYQYWLQACQ